MSALSPRQMFLLDIACHPIRQAFPSYGPYLVGTASRYQKGDPAPRDVDVRCIMSDESYDAMVGGIGIHAVRFFNLAISQYLTSVTDLPVDFQFQRQTEANDGRFPDGWRNALGTRSMSNYVGDADGHDISGQRVTA